LPTRYGTTLASLRPCMRVLIMGANLTILIAEDDANDVLILKKALERADIKYPIYVVPDGQEAIDYLRGEGQYSDRTKFPFPNVVFMDLKMPRMSGFDVLEWSKNNPECAVIPVIILSASKQDEDIKKAYQMGANAYLVKPSQIGDLQEMVKTSFSFWAWCEKPNVSGKC
jgi:CheY-like chemotaxis protein